MAMIVQASFPAVSRIVLGAISELLHNASLPYDSNARVTTADYPDMSLHR